MSYCAHSQDASICHRLRPFDTNVHTLSRIILNFIIISSSQYVVPHLQDLKLPNMKGAILTTEEGGKVVYDDEHGQTLAQDILMSQEESLMTLRVSPHWC